MDEDIVKYFEIFRNFCKQMEEKKVEAVENICNLTGLPKFPHCSRDIGKKWDIYPILIILNKIIILQIILFLRQYTCLLHKHLTQARFYYDLSRFDTLSQNHQVYVT